MPRVNDLIIAPNPCHGEVTLVRSLPGSVKVDVLDLLGRQMLPSFSMQGSTVLPIHDLPPGIYFVRTTDSHRAVTVRRMTVE